MPAKPNNSVAMSPAEQQFAMALRMLKAATDNMAVAFDQLLASRSASEPPDVNERTVDPLREGAVPGRKTFGERALRAIDAAEKLNADGTTSSQTVSDAEQSENSSTSSEA